VILLPLLALFATAALIVITGITILNVLTFPRLDRAPDPTSYPHVSLLIPARNEAGVIRTTVRRLLAQSYPNLEIMILDDNSSDGTAQAADAAAADDPRVRVIQGDPLPQGWLGKNWACHQLAKQAQSDILVFTDADVIWTPNAVARLVGEMERRRSDLQTVWPTQITGTWTERLVVPLMAHVIVGYLPLLAVHHAPWPIFAAAMGQCLAFRRSAYEAVGGHAVVRGSVIEDVAFAKLIKQQGLRLRVADGGGVIRCRMYHDWSEVRDGFAKNILAGHGDSIPFLLLSWAFHWLLWLAPWVWLAAGLGGRSHGYPWWPLALIALGVGVRALTAIFSRQRALDALAMPISTLLMAVIANQAIWWQIRYGGPRWRGRTISAKPETGPSDPTQAAVDQTKIGATTNRDVLNNTPSRHIAGGDDD
jgi:chlorobactene glucosyltransferase